MRKRKLRVYGQCVDASGTVTVNNKIVHCGPFCGPLLYEFETDTTLHGHVDVTIELSQGIISITHIDAVYPATINDACQGWYVFKQPIEHPIIDSLTKQPFLLPVKIADKLFYKHLMFNGPTEFKVSVDQKINLINSMEVHDSLVDYKKAQWSYTPQELNLDKLLNW